MAGIGSLVVDAQIKLAKFSADSDAMRKHLSSIAGKADSVATAFKAAFAGLAGFAAVEKLRVIAELGTQMGRVSDSTGIAVETLAALRFQADQAGIGFDQVSEAISKFGIRVAQGAAGNEEMLAAFKALGITQEDLRANLGNTEGLLGRVATAFSTYANGANKSAIAAKLFEEGGIKLIPLLNQGAEGLTRARSELESFGGLLGGKMVEDSKKFNEQMARLRALSEATSLAIGGPLLTSVNSLLGELLKGREIAGGFASAIGLFGTINPFRDLAGNIKATRESIEDLEKARARYQRSNSDTRSIDQALETEKKRLEFLQFQQRADALRRFSGDEFKDARDLRSQALPDAPALPSAPKAPGVDQGAQFLETLRKRLLAIQEDEYAVLRLEAAQKRVAASAEPLIEQLRRQTEFQKEHAEAVQRDVAAMQEEQSRRFSLVDQVAKYIEGLEEETALQRLSNEQRLIATQLLRLEQAGISKTSEEYAAAAERIRAAVNANAGAVLTRELRTPLEKANDEMQRLRDLFGAGAIDAVTFQRGVAAINEELSKTDSATQSAEDAVKSLGLTFSSAFEEAVAGGKSFRDILKGIESDLLKLGTRKFVTEPLLKGFEGLIGNGVKGLFGNSASSVNYQNSFDNPLTGGGGGSGGFSDILGAIFSKFVGSFAEGTDYVPRDGFAMVHRGERIVTAEENRRGGAMVVNQHFTISGPMTPQSQSQIAAAALRGLERGRRNL